MDVGLLARTLIQLYGMMALGVVPVSYTHLDVYKRQRLYYPQAIGRLRLKEDGSLIEVKNLVKRYGDHCAVDHLSFTVADGQIYGFLGPNGAGKSTTMNIMTGYLAATEGEVLIEGHNVLEEPEEARRCIGYLPEIPPVYPEMTVREYLHFCAQLKKIPKAEQELSLIHIYSPGSARRCGGILSI